MANYTPMMEQYFQIKGQYKDCLLLFRLGDFYELFFDDAITASNELDIVLTGRECGQAERAPMCGVPYHAADAYIAKLVEKGYRVAVCDQTEDARYAKGIVKREVIRVVTPGTVTDTQKLDEGRYNFITCLYQDASRIACATADITTGLFMVTAVPSDDENDGQQLIDELSRLAPAEIITHDGFPHMKTAQIAAGVKPASVPAWTFYPQNAFKRLTSHFKTLHLEGFGIQKNAPEVCAAGALLQYLSETQKNALNQITALKLYSRRTRMQLDAQSRRNLELTDTPRGRKDSLLGVLDRTKTAMGARLLRGWVEQPLLSRAEINARLDAVEELKNDALLRAELRELLNAVHDLERLMGKLANGAAGGRDVNALRASFAVLPHIRALITDLKTETNAEIYRTFDALEDLYMRIDALLVDDPPVSIREGGLVRQGYDKELDALLLVKANGKQWLAELESREREATGIKNLKVRYNKVFGYYIEITQAQVQNAPARYIRRQTLANCERFVTEELKKLEETILNADENQTGLEYTLFDALRRELVEQMARIQFTAFSVAALDALASLAEAADRGRYVKPAVNDGGAIRIREGRHPVLERRTEHAFVPNDTEMDNDALRLSIITGPNMAGKSTYMRQTALIVLMAQIGSFVPAGSAEIGVVDRIFTRVGASDDLATGQSTFMVEMTETANILNNATKNSLILLDEIGRGTSTFDGLSIAWAVLEYIAESVGAKTLFATHYHELTELEGRVRGVVNYCFTVHEADGEVVFLRRLTRGGAGQSFGIHVARLAGLPPRVLARAGEVLSALNDADITHSHEWRLKETLRGMDIESITPLEASMELERLKAMAGAV